MNTWIQEFFSKVGNAEAITRENRRKFILRYTLLTSITLMIILAAIRVTIWVQDPSSVNSFFLANSILGILLFLVNLHFNEINHTRTAGIFFLVTAYYLCLTTYPIRNLDQVLLYFSLPTVIASFVQEPRSSFKYACFSSIGFFILYFAYFRDQFFPIFSFLILFVFATVASLVAKIILQMNDQLVSAYDKTIQGWSEALEMRNQETEGHSSRVADLTLQLAKHMKINKIRWDHIHRGVLLHDIGKMGVPDSILCKPGPLNNQEMEVMRSHPLFGYKLLCNIPYLQPALEIPYCHHEKWDGTGYPRGLKGEEIPLEARIFTVIDVWDAMRSKRSYRPAIPEHQVIEYLRSESGRSFDPHVVREFFDLMAIESQPAAVKNKTLTQTRRTHSRA